MKEKLQKLNIEVDEQNIILFENFIKFFLDYNEKVNLISNNDSKVLFEKHMFDSLAFNLFYEKYKKQNKIKLLDLGTGGGFPALPLALFYKDINVSAVDSIKKKIHFIELAAENFKLHNIKPLCYRIEDLPSNFKSGFDIVTSRAMAELRIILEYSIPYLKVGGYFVAYKSLKAEEELENAKNAMKILNVNLIDKIEYTLPLETENRRVLLVFKKTKQTSPVYPRKNGVIKKQPL